MALRVPDVSADHVEAVRSHLSDLAGAPVGGALEPMKPTAVALAVPHHVYSLGLDDLARGARLDEATPGTLRFLVMEGDAAIASAELGAEGGFQSNEGPFVAATVAAIRDAENIAEVADGSYELRALRIPALYLMALWLKDDRGEADIVIPMAPAPAPLEAERRYPPEELIPQLAEMAERMLGSMERPDEEGG